MPKRNPKSSRKLILVCAVVVLTTGAVSFALLRPGGVLNREIQQTSDTTQPAKSESPVAEAPSENVTDEQYLALEDWGVKFEMPEGVGEVKYYKRNNNIYPELKSVADEWYEFSTKRVEALGGKGDDICVEPNERKSPASRLGGIIRSTEILPVGSEPLNAQPIGGYYYYYYGSSQSMCSTKDTDMQQNDSNTIHSMLQTISSAH